MLPQADILLPEQVPITVGTMIRTKPPQRERVKQALLNPLTIQRNLNNKRFYHFFRYFWDEVSTTSLQDNWHIEYLCDELQKVVERVAAGKPKLYDLIINVPPGTTKTTIVNIMLNAWAWTKYFKLKFASASYSSSLSMEVSDKVRDLLDSDKFREMYPELMIRVDKDTKSNFQVIRKLRTNKGKAYSIKNGGSRYTTSVGGTLTGFHGDLLLVDDPINPKQAMSETMLKTVNNWLDQTLSTRLIDKKVSVMILIMQRLNQDDPTGHILKQGTPVKHICLPGEIVNYEKVLKPAYLKINYKNGLLDPNRLPFLVLENMRKKLGQYGYAGQIGQNPVPLTGGMFKVDMFQYITHPFAEVNYVQTVRYWDKAGTKDGGAYTVGVKMSKLRNGKFIVEDVKRGQWSTGERERIIRATAEADGVHVEIWIEQEPGSGGKESAENTIRNLAGFRVYAERPSGDKVYRADPYSVQVEVGNVYLMQAPWNKDYIDELKYFPNGTYKDQVDASSGAFHALVRKKQVRRIR